MQNIRWAVLGTGVIANEMAVALKKNGRNIDAVGNRTHEKAVAFAEKYGIKKVYDNYNDMFTDPDIDVIYITTPHNTHINFMRRAIENGKHILVEKSITLNSRELDEAIALADKKGVVIGEAMTIYHMPIYKKLKEILESGKLGKVNLITMNFGSFKEYDMNNRFFNKNLAGGAMLDIGVYALSFIRWFMDSKPDQLLSQVKPAPTGVDEQAGLLLMNQEGQMASVMLSLHSKQPKRGMVSCEKGYIEIMEYPRAWEARITYTDSGETEVIQTGDFDIKDVCDKLCDKLIFRHPHVFGEVKADTAEKVSENWEQIKMKEKDGNKSVLSGVPDALPSLIKAYRIQDKARNVGFDWEERSQVWSKVKEEIGEFEAEVENMDKEKAEAEFGDVMFSLINAARLYKINPDNALEHTNQKFIRRFNYLEEHTIKQGKDLRDMSLEEMDAVWNEAKSKGL